MKIKILVILLCLFTAGCGEEFVAGFGSGVTAMGVMADDAEEKFINAVNELNAETKRINDNVDGIEGTILVRPETLEAIRNLKGREKDPITWIALVSILANAFIGGKMTNKKG